MTTQRSLDKAAPALEPYVLSALGRSLRAVLAGSVEQPVPPGMLAILDRLESRSIPFASVVAYPRGAGDCALRGSKAQQNGRMLVTAGDPVREQRL